MLRIIRKTLFGINLAVKRSVATFSKLPQAPYKFISMQAHQAPRKLASMQAPQAPHRVISTQPHIQTIRRLAQAIHEPVRANIPTSGRKTVVIIGGRSQVGETLRTHYLAEGYNVVCTTQGAAPKLDEKDLHWEGKVNIGDEKARTDEYWKELFTQIRSKHGAIHTVVNCAAISINDPVNGYTMDDVNRRPVLPMLKACISLGIDRYTFISSQAAKYEKVRYSGSYALSKYDAEQDILEYMAANPGTKTQTSILRADFIVSAGNAGHLGGPQRMSTLPFKVTVGDEDTRKAGSTPLQPITDINLAQAVVNISEYDISTPHPIDACGPDVISLDDLGSFFKSRQHSSFFFGLKIPTASLRPLAAIWPWGTLEPGHLDLIGHHEKYPIGKIDISEFKKLVALNGSELLTLDDIFAFTKRPVFGNSGLALYTRTFFKHVKPQDVIPLAKGMAIGLLKSRIDFHPHKKTAERGPNDGINLFALLATGTLFSAGMAAKKSQDKDKSEPAVKLEGSIRP